MYIPESDKPTLNSQDERIKTMNKNFFFVRSFTEEDKWYEIRRAENENIWQCTCPDFRKKLQKGFGNKICKHIERAQIERQILEIYSSEENTKEHIFCVECFSSKIKKGGLRKLKDGGTIQRYICRDCGYRFVSGGKGFRVVKKDPRIVVEAIDLLMKGMSARDISRHIQDTTGIKISYGTVLNYPKKFMEIIRIYVDSNLSPMLGDTWCLDEMMINVKNTKKTGKGRYVWLWSIIDTKTKFVIASLISKQREINDAEEILSVARSRSGNDPNYIITDLLRPYEKAITEIFGKSVAHIKSKSLSKGFANRPIERYHNEVRSVIKSNRGFGNDKSAAEALDNYRVYHNFIRPHSGLPNNITPAEAAGIQLNLGMNKIEGLITRSTQDPRRDFAIQLGKRIEKVDIINEGDCIRVVPKEWIIKKTWREINDILKINDFAWLPSEPKGYWIR